MKIQTLKVIPQTLRNVCAKSEKGDATVNTKPTPTYM